MKNFKEMKKMLFDTAIQTMSGLTVRDVLFELLDMIMIIITIFFFRSLNVSNIELALLILLLVCNRNMRKFKRS